MFLPREPIGAGPQPAPDRTMSPGIAWAKSATSRRRSHVMPLHDWWRWCGDSPPDAGHRELAAALPFTGTSAPGVSVAVAQKVADEGDAGLDGSLAGVAEAEHQLRRA